MNFSIVGVDLSTLQNIYLIQVLKYHIYIYVADLSSLSEYDKKIRELAKTVENRHLRIEEQNAYRLY